MTSRTATARRLASELSLPVDDDLLEQVIAGMPDTDAANGPGGRSSDRNDQSRVVDPSDPFNSMLDRYDTPRSTASTGPLADVTIAIKDNIAVDGLSMTCAAREQTYVPSFDATVTERVLAAGGGIAGKANMDAFALGPGGLWSEYGQVVNPIDEDRIPGGSSSGSAASVAGGVVDAAIGTDSGGSVRAPAACCGVVGVKPTHRLVPRYGFVELMPSTDVIGPIAPDVETAARVLDVIAGPDPRDPMSVAPESTVDVADPSIPSELDVGIVESTFNRSSDRVAEAVRRVGGTLGERSGVAVTEIDLNLGSTDEAFTDILGAEFAALVRQSFTTRGQGVQYNQEWRAAFADPPFNENVARRVLPGALADCVTDGRAYVKARSEAIAFTERLDECFDRVDVLLAPTLRFRPPTLKAFETSSEVHSYTNTKPFSLAGAPAVTVPVTEVDGLPISAQVVAPPFEDALALQGARLLEAVAE